MLQYWSLMGIERVDEDHRTLQAMEQTRDVAWLVDVVAEAKRRHHEWLAEHRPDLVERALKVP